MHTTPQRQSGRAGTRSLAWGVLAAAVLQVIAPVITINGPGASPGSGSGPDLLITPVGWAFSIWGVIYALAIAQAIGVLVRGGDIPLRLQLDQIVLYLGGALWIALAGLDSSQATAGALLLMLVAAVDGVLTAARRQLHAGWLTVLTRAAVGLYAGWVTAAFFLNASTALVDSGVVEADELSWQVGVLVAAVLTLVALTIASRGILTYAAAGVWALLGIAVTGRSDGTTEVVTVAAISAIVLVATTAALRLTGHRPAAHHTA
ncbi:hypothetical protein [Aeromicrobium sp. NPDC092404]|uniref:hypothetical protein n=1 Tax=Aeromicrobium sp. NPDC092404 TaxID=3154976 RepID=UPI00344A600A